MASYKASSSRGKALRRRRGRDRRYGRVGAACESFVVVRTFCATSMWARHPVSSGSSWPVIVFAVSLWIGLRPLRPPQSRKRRVRCAKEPTHKPKLRASEKTHQTEGSWTRLAAMPRHELLVMGPATWWLRKKVPLKLPLPLSLVLFPRGVLAGVLVFLPRQACWQTRRCSSQVVRCIQSCNKLHYSQLLRLRSDAAAGLLLASSYCTLPKLDPQKAPLRGA
jgi:hypothetical protein